MNFDQLDLSKEMLRGLKKMGFSAATPVQEQTISPMLEAQDLLVQSPTGSGKTCAFGIPVIESVDTSNRNVQTIILCPTRELALQTTKVLQQLIAFKQGIKIVSLYGGEPIGKQLSAMRKKPQIVVATPGRLMDHIDRRTVKLGKVRQVVMDEADRMLDMGFRDDMDTILESVPQERQTVLFSATLSKEILQIADSYQTDAQKIKIGQEVRTVDSVKQFYVTVGKGGKEKALDTILRQREGEQSLVFVSTKSMADTLSETLFQDGFHADALHGGLRQVQRDRVMARFRKGSTRVLVATDVAARGIDVNDMGAVINYDIPGDSDDYVHRIGRTGRANNSGIAYTFVYPREQGRLKQIIRDTKAPIEELEIPGLPKAKVSRQKQSGYGKKKPYAASDSAKKPSFSGRKRKNPWENNNKHRQSKAG